MTVVDKNKAIVDYLLTCSTVYSSSLYFNFINAKDDTKQVIAEASDTYTNRNYIDGSVLKQYQCKLVNFKSLSTKPVVKQSGYADENITDLETIQQIVDWINEQNDLNNYPDFGDNCIVEKIQTTANNPVLDGIDASTTPALVKYSITIQVDYLDKSKIIWNKVSSGGDTTTTTTTND